MVIDRRESRPDVGRYVRHGRLESSVCERLVVEGEAREGDVAPDRLPVLRQNLVTIDIVDFLQPSATLYWYGGITILTVLFFQSSTLRSMQFGS